MAISYFTSSAAGFMPTEHAVGPWAPDMLHGRFFGAFAARAIEAEHVEAGWRVSRLTVDMFRPAGFEPVAVTTNVLRSGRRIRVVDAVVTSAGIDVAAVRAVVLAEGEAPPGEIWSPEPWVSPPPESLPRSIPPDGVDPNPAWDIRIHEGGFRETARARVWTNESGLLLDDEPVTPIVRAALSGDLASPLANGGERGIGYINADYTLAMVRPPQGPWIGLETTSHLADAGTALGASTLYDLGGPFATSTTTALANPILD